MPIIPTSASTNVPTYSIYVEGVEINSSYRILNINVNKEYNKISHAEINLLDGNISTQDFEASNTDDFMIGKNVEIQAGYQGQNSTVFKGVVVQHGIKILENGGSSLYVILKNKIYRSTMVRNTKIYNDLTDSEIFEEIINKYAWNKEIEANNVRHESVTQYNCSDWDFINMRAEANAQLVFTNDDQIIIKKPDLTAEPKVTLTYGTSILELEAEMDGRTSFQNYKSSCWNYSNQEITEVEKSSSNLNLAQGNTSTSDVASSLQNEEFKIHVDALMQEENEISNLTDSYILKNNLSRIKGRVKSVGIADINPGDIIELSGIGNRFNGNALVSGVSHSINDGMWITHIQFGLDSVKYVEKYDNIKSCKANGIMSAVSGLQIGIVVQIEDDPLGEGRIKIKLPVITETENTLWARVSTLDAGTNRGTFFRPEVDDEVIVGFISDNANYPIVLGMLHSSALPPPIQAESENNCKGIYTRESLKLEFDDGKKSILLETPNGNKVTISEDEEGIFIEDMNGNKITLDTNGIKLSDLNSNKVTLESSGLKLQDAGGNEISISSSGIKIMSPGTVEIQGAQIKLNGSTIQLQGAMTEVAGMLKTDILNATSVIATSYTPGAGNIW